MNATENDKSNQSEAARIYEKSSENNRNLLLFYLIAIVYIIIIVATTTDLKLLLPASFISLPVLSVGIPLTYFYVLSSPLVLILHFNLLYNTTEHQKKIKKWEKEESINLLHSTIEHQKKIKQWEKEEFIFSYLMHPYAFDFAYLSPSGRWGKILVLSTDSLLYFLAPACLLYIQFRFSDYQSFWYSSWHFICLLVDLYLLVLFFNEAHNSSRKKQNSGDTKGVAVFLRFFNYTGKLHKEDRKIFSVITLIFFIGIANFLIVGMLQFNTTIEWLKKPREFARSITMYSEFTMPIGKWLDEFIAPKITIPPETKIQKQNLEDLKLIAIQIDTSNTKAWRSHGENYNLSGRQLVFSDFSDSYMQKIILENAYLQGSNMQRAQMQGAKMKDARLQGADMEKAQLQGADIWYAKLQGANLKEAKLQGADMEKVELQSANLKEAELQDAYMHGAQLQDADMRGAQLQGADMRGAQLQGADMGDAQLQGADMRHAELQGTDMRRAELQGADMCGAQLQGANIWMVKFSGAGMDKANLRGSFCEEKKYDGFFDRMNARIRKRGLEGCNTIGDSQFGALNKGTADSIIKSLRNNGNVSEEIMDKIEKNISNRVGKDPSMVKVEKGRLKFEEACDIIENWFKSLEYVPGLKKTFADWINTGAGKESRLKECPSQFKFRAPCQSSEKIDSVKGE